jgi:ribosomal protein S17E
LQVRLSPPTTSSWKKLLSQKSKQLKNNNVEGYTTTSIHNTDEDFISEMSGREPNINPFHA